MPILHPGIKTENHGQKGHNGSVMVKNDSMITPITYILQRYLWSKSRKSKENRIVKKKN